MCPQIKFERLTRTSQCLFSSNSSPFFQNSSEFITSVDPEDRTQGEPRHITCELDQNSGVEDIMDKCHDEHTTHVNDHPTNADQGTLICPNLKTNFRKCLKLYSYSTPEPDCYPQY